MLGNSVDCRVVKAIGVETAFQLMMDRLNTTNSDTARPASARERSIPQDQQWMRAEPDGQFAFILGA